jgi:hypothetical protein
MCCNLGLLGRLNSLLVRVVIDPNTPKKSHTLFNILNILNTPHEARCISVSLSVSFVR